MNIYNAIVCGLWMITLVYWAAAAVRKKKYSDRTRTHSTVGILIGVLVLSFFILQSRSVQHLIQQLSPAPVGPVMGITSVFLAAAGAGLAIWARAHLSKNWGIPMAVKQKPELVTSGPYKFVRHPIYTGFILALIGSALASGTVWIFLLLPMCAYFVFSAFIEEKVLAMEFPARYPEYKKRSKMLLPFIL
jgi:protein-S-isoprenylcysteine O-methyltransferase Ste14